MSCFMLPKALSVVHKFPKLMQQADGINCSIIGNRGTGIGVKYGAIIRTQIF